MRPKENYLPLTGTAFGLTLAILISFQVYLVREPARIAADEAHDKGVAVSEGKAIFVNYCTQCHGKQGEGAKGPALNDKGFLAEVGDARLFSLISSGVPGTEMPAWNQIHGGPFTDQEVRELVAFIRNWEPNAPDRRATPPVGDPARGATIFASICIVCHGEDGKGTERAPALNDLARLKQLDDAWYRDTITQGRPAKGMPTWGTVLSPQQITDLLALLDAWRQGQLVAPQP
jgi:cbb3-type cytochrome c oxidase subunit III